MTPAKGRAGQRGRVLQALLRGEVLTGVSALERYGVAHLSSRITELLQDGVPVRKEWVLIDCSYGGQARVRAYRLDPEDQAKAAP